jgi:hypothetical protein
MLSLEYRDVASVLDKLDSSTQARHPGTDHDDRR